MGRNVYLDIDISDVKEKVDALRKVHTQDEMTKLLRRALIRTGGKVKSIVSSDVPKKYNIKKKTVAKDIGRPIMGNMGSANIACNIPIEGKRHIIGGNTFPAAGGRHGWRGIKAGKRYKIYTQIIKGKRVALPATMDNQGGNPPFRNLGASKLNNAVFTRDAGAGFPPAPNNLPLKRVVGLAVPQMPMNRAQDDVQEHIMNYMIDRLEREHQNIIRQRCK